MSLTEQNQGLFAQIELQGCPPKAYSRNGFSARSSMDRATGFYPVGWGFESLRAYQHWQKFMFVDLKFGRKP